MIVAVPFGLRTPVPTKPIGVTGAGVLLMMMITEPSRNPAAVGSNRTVNWQEDPWLTTCPEQPSAVIGKTDGVPVTMNACWICIGASPSFATVTVCEALLPIARLPKSVCNGPTTACGPFSAVAFSGMISGLLRLGCRC